MSHTASRAAFTLKGWHVLIALLVFFGVDIAINTVFMVTAYKTFPGETSITPYEDGLAYNSALAQLHDQESRAWRITAGADDEGRLKVQAFDRTGAPLKGLKVSAELIRPATEAGRRSVAFHETAPGTYLADTSALNGAWDLDVTLVDAHGRKALADRRLVLP